MASIVAQPALSIERDAPIPTWFGIGGRADRLCRPASVEQLRECLKIDPSLRVLGEGANLLVDDEGVRELIVALSAGAFTSTEFRDDGTVVAGAGADLAKLIVDAARRGRAGLEGLAGIPATVGGAAIMNAGGAFGQVSDVIARVHALDRAGREVVLERTQIGFDYRRSGLNDLVLTSVEFNLPPADPRVLRERLKDVMAYKKRSQPMAERSAGCVFKNPTLPHDVADIGPAGSRTSAGMLIDRAGCKGLRLGGASVSPRHANFIVTDRAATARAVIELMQQVAARVQDAFGVTLEPEVVIWRRSR